MVRIIIYDYEVQYAHHFDVFKIESTMYLAVKSVRPLEDYRLFLTFENDEERIFDVQPYLDIGKFSELKERALFNSVFISFDSIQWANQLDLDPEFLYQKSLAA